MGLLECEFFSGIPLKMLVPMTGEWDLITALFYHRTGFIQR